MQAREFLLNEKVRGQPVAKKVEYLQKQLQLNDQDLEEVNYMHAPQARWKRCALGARSERDQSRAGVGKMAKLEGKEGTRLPAPIGANKKSTPRGAPMQHLVSLAQAG